MKCARPLLCLGLLAGLAAVSIGFSLRSRAHRSERREAPEPRAMRAYDPDRIYKLVAFWEGRVRHDPEGAISMAMLAQHYLQRCRETGDAADAARAEAMARRSLKVRAKRNNAALDALAQSLAVQHRFREAMEVTRRALRQDPDDLQAVQIAAESALETGQYDRAWALARALKSPEAHLALRGITARLLEIDGRPAEALVLLRACLCDAERNQDLPVEAVAWYHVRIAGLLRQLGQSAAAVDEYKLAIRIFPRDYRAMVGLAKLYADGRDHRQALLFASKAAEIVPTPETMALIGDCRTALGHPAEARAAYAAVEAAARLASAKGVALDRQRALFLADHGGDLKQALAIMRTELRSRRDIFAYDALAWVCHRAGRRKEAEDAMGHAMSRGCRDPRLLAHAAVVLPEITYARRSVDAAG